MIRVDLEALERCYAYGKPSVLPVGVLFDIIAELKAGRALVDNLECAIVSTIEAEASRVLVRSALRGFREATKVEG